MSLLYVIPGFATVNCTSNVISISQSYSTFLLISLFLAFLPNSFYETTVKFEINGNAVHLFYFFLFQQIIALPYFYTKAKLNKSFSRWHQFLITFSTSPLGLFLGWFIYKISH